MSKWDTDMYLQLNKQENSQLEKGEAEWQTVAVCTSFLRDSRGPVHPSCTTGSLLNID